MLSAILEGILLGLGLSIIPGPSLFTLLQTSIDRGLKSAFYLASGIFLSDCFLVFITLLGAANVLGTESAKHIVGIIGGILLIGFGIYTFKHRGAIVAKPAEIDPDLAENLPPSFLYVLKGFFLNMANPATWFFWFFWVGVISSQFSHDGKVIYQDVIAFFSITLITVFSSDLLKSFIADKLRRYMTATVLYRINRLVGLALCAFGLYLTIKSVIPYIF